MHRLDELVAAVPRMVGLGLLDCSGGTIAARTPEGVFVSALQAPLELDWEVGKDDFILFPGEGDASLARAGRRPSHENHLHRGVLNAFPNWNFTYHGHPSGLLACCYNGIAPRLSQSHARRIGLTGGNSLPMVPEATGPVEHQTSKAVELLQSSFKGGCGAVLIGGDGPLVAAATISELIAVAVLLEKIANAALVQFDPAG